MEQEETIKEINRLAKILVSLTEDPHPGLISWTTAVFSCLDKLEKLWKEK